MTLWGRRALVIAVVAATLATTQLPAFAAVKPAPAITMRPLVMRAKARYIWTIYHSKKYSKIHSKGTVTGATSGMVLRFYADVFPYASGWQPIAQRVLHNNGTNDYNFTATPALATRYKLELFQDASSTTPLVVTKSTTVYLLANYRHSPIRKCAHPICRQLIRVFVSVPPTTLATEIAKRVYAYFNYTVASHGTPPALQWLYKGIGHLHLTRSRQVAAGQFKYTISFWFRINNDRSRWLLATCSKDTERIDGLNLPGHHGCGSRRVFANTPYIG